MGPMKEEEILAQKMLLQENSFSEVSVSLNAIGNNFLSIFSRSNGLKRLKNDYCYDIVYINNYYYCYYCCLKVFVNN